MSSANPQFLSRKRGPKPKFAGERLIELLTYLAEPDSTIDGAAAHFGCATRTVEYALQRARKRMKGVSDKTPDVAATSPDAETPSEPSVPTKERRTA